MILTREAENRLLLERNLNQDRTFFNVYIPVRRAFGDGQVFSIPPAPLIKTDPSQIAQLQEQQTGSGFSNPKNNGWPMHKAHGTPGPYLAPTGNQKISLPFVPRHQVGGWDTPLGKIYPAGQSTVYQRFPNVYGPLQTPSVLRPIDMGHVNSYNRIRYSKQDEMPYERSQPFYNGYPIKHTALKDNPPWLIT